MSERDATGLQYFDVRVYDQQDKDASHFMVFTQVLMFPADAAELNRALGHSQENARLWPAKEKR